MADAKDNTGCLGHFHKKGIVSMSQQKPRDNSMYYISEANNLSNMDKAVIRRSDKT